MTGVADDAYLGVPLHGVQAIEASAGTGKTFTLATLVLRMVLERGLRIEQILAVTFTEAATQELRARIRDRLRLAAALLDDPSRTDDAPEAAITRAVLDTALASSEDSIGTLRQRLRAAIDGIDLAAIFTIHGFCARVLRDHALESGHGFDTPDLLASDRDLREEIAADLWRAHGVVPETAEDLLALWPRGPEALAADLSDLVREPALVPASMPVPDDPLPVLRAAAGALMVAVREHGDDFRAAILSAIAGKVINAQSYKAAWVEDVFEALAVWSWNTDPTVMFAHAQLERLTRDVLVARTNKNKDASRPESPLSDAVARYIAARDEVERHIEARQVRLLHTLRAAARQRLALRKRQQRVQTYDDLIDGVAEALSGAPAGTLVQRLRGQYRIALVDEFQDTDARQWQIFDRVFGIASGDPALFLIGDPKQAIYGFRGADVDIYLIATATAEVAPALARNFRSRPALLRALDAMYAQAGQAFETGLAKAPPFVIDGIDFHPVRPGGNRQDGDHVRNGRPAPALTLWRAAPTGEFDSKGRPTAYSAGRSRDQATAACVAAIHRVLSDARAGTERIEGRPVQPGDIAVLVRSHSDATRIRQALAVVGIAAVAAGRQSLFATDEARDLHALLLALLHGADDGRLRMALATVLVGVDAAGIAALASDGPALRDWRLRALAWRDRLQHGGALALVNDLCAQQAQRLLGLLDGERRLTNYLQLAEALQEAQRDALGLHGLVDWLNRAIAQADSNDDSQQLRLESDARRVQVVTLHKSKGLEYPLVFLPYAGIGGRPRSAGRHVVVNARGGRVLHWKLQTETSGWAAAESTWKTAQQAEDARLLYVGLTRARHALWLAVGDFYNHDRTALWPLVARPDDLAAAVPGAVVIDDDEPPAELPWLPPQGDTAVPPARNPRHPVTADWWVYSFTQLANADRPAGIGVDGGSVVLATASEDGGGAADEPVLDPRVADVPAAGSGDDPTARFAGSRFGNVLHAALERTDFTAWAHWRVGDAAPDGQDTVLRDALRGEGYVQADLDDGLALLTTLVGRTLTVVLPEGDPLHALDEHARRAEIEFHFALQATAVPALLVLLHHHGIVRARRGFGLRRRLEGLMTGKIDLTYTHAGRWYVLDYKSNRLPRYDADTLAAAMADSEYDLQALIYTLALHRWLRFRLGGGYDYARDFGGVRYLFCRGLSPHTGSGDGVFAHRFEPGLVHALDALFAGAQQETAA